MSKTILLGVSTHRSRIVPRVGYTFFGLYFIGYSLYYFTKDAQNIPDMIFRASLLLVGLAYIVYANIVFNANARFAPRITIDNDEIFYKTGFFNKGSIISWSDVRSIEFKPYRLYFTMLGENVNLRYDANAEVSIDIKEAIREIADKKEIELIGG